MSEPIKFRKIPPSSAPTPRQKTIAFESGLTRPNQSGAHEGREAVSAGTDAGSRDREGGERR
jgi:hypothetical protein